MKLNSTVKAIQKVYPEIKQDLRNIVSFAIENPECREFYFGDKIKLSAPNPQKMSEFESRIESLLSILKTLLPQKFKVSVHDSTAHGEEKLANGSNNGYPAFVHIVIDANTESEYCFSHFGYIWHNRNWLGRVSREGEIQFGRFTYVWGFMTYEEIEIPADVIDEARDYRGRLLEAVAEFDDTLLEKYFEDEIFLNFFSDKINNLKVVELGCGFGLRLFNLKEQKDYSLIGYDINKKYINLAKKYNEEKKYNIEFCLKKIEDIKLENDVDYLISSFSLIYVKEKDLIKFFINNKDMIRKGFIFIEYHTPSKSENLSYYVHNFQKIFDETLSNDFEIYEHKIGRASCRERV